MNVRRNGIPIAIKHNQVKYGKPFRETPNPYTHYVTLFRKEQGTPVWLVMPFIKRDVKQLKREGWYIVDFWAKRK